MHVTSCNSYNILSGGLRCDIDKFTPFFKRLAINPPKKGLYCDAIKLFGRLFGFSARYSLYLKYDALAEEDTYL